MFRFRPFFFGRRRGVKPELGNYFDSGRSRSGFRPRLADFASGIDFIQIGALLCLIGTGLLFIYSTGAQIGGDHAASFFFRQLRWIGAGGILWLFCSLIDYRKIQYRILAVLFYLVTIVLLVLVFFIGVKVYGATRWLSIAPLGMRLQPSEFCKLALVMVLSAMFASPMFKVNRLPCLLLGAGTVALPFVLIVREPDLGSALILLPIYLAILFTAGLKWRYILLAGVAISILGGAVVLNEAMQFRPMLKEYQRDRIRVFLNPELDRTDTGYNSYQARLAVGSGGLTGKGIGEGTQNTLGFLPQTVSNNDFIFSVIAEEVGFLGCLLLLAAYLALFYSIIRTAFLTVDPFGRYLAVGIAGIFFTHCFINIGMSIGLAPVTGLSLPFVSYGGSFMLMGLAACGLLQSVYRYRNSR